MVSFLVNWRSHRPCTAPSLQGTLVIYFSSLCYPCNIQVLINSSEHRVVPGLPPMAFMSYVGSLMESSWLYIDSICYCWNIVKYEQVWLGFVVVFYNMYIMYINRDLFVILMIFQIQIVHFISMVDLICSFFLFSFFCNSCDPIGAEAEDLNEQRSYSHFVHQKKNVLR